MLKAGEPRGVKLYKKGLKIFLMRHLKWQGLLHIEGWKNV